jgi:hypothetical protein
MTVPLFELAFKVDPESPFAPATSIRRPDDRRAPLRVRSEEAASSDRATDEEPARR